MAHDTGDFGIMKEEDEGAILVYCQWDVGSFDTNQSIKAGKDRVHPSDVATKGRLFTADEKLFFAVVAILLVGEPHFMRHTLSGFLRNSAMDTLRLNLLEQMTSSTQNAMDVLPSKVAWSPMFLFVEVWAYSDSRWPSRRPMLFQSSQIFQIPS